MSGLSGALEVIFPAAGWNGMREFRALIVSVLENLGSRETLPVCASTFQLCASAAVKNSAFTDSRERTIIVKTPRIVPKGIKRHSMQAITNANQSEEHTSELQSHHD